MRDGLAICPACEGSFDQAKCGTKQPVCPGCVETVPKRCVEYLPLESEFVCCGKLATAHEEHAGRDQKGREIRWQK